MWKILLFLEKWIMYPVIFTICFAIYYIMYVIILFELPYDMNYIKKYENEHHKDLSMGDTAHVLSAILGCMMLAAILFYIFYSPSEHIYSRNVCR